MLGGDAEGRFLDMVTLDTKLSCKRERRRSNLSREEEMETSGFSEEEGGVILWFP